jgi:release factor glutamine methyltransferase
MSVSLSSRHRSVVVARLRAAGCVFAEDEARLLISAALTPDDLTAMVDRRVAGLPLEHVLGWAEFCGLRIAVDPGVFVPRRRTEFLVEQAVALVRPAAGAPPVVVDLCCGSGAVGAAIAAALGRTELHAADIDPAAVACARRNLAAAGGQVYEGDLYQPLPATLRGRVDILAANVPYVPTEEVGLLPPEARTHEPLLALDGGADGLHVLRRVAAAAPRWLAPGGHLLTETSERQAPGAVEAVAASGLTPRVASSDERNATVIIGTRATLARLPSDDRQALTWPIPPPRPVASGSAAESGRSANGP